MMSSQIINNLLWLCVIISLSGNFFIIKKNILGFYLWLIADLFLIFYNFHIHEIAQGVLNITYTIFCLYGIKQWRINDKNN